jgi:hypothetical protein
MLNDSLEEIKKRSNNFSSWDEYDVLRAKIYFKEHKLNKSYVIFRDLTEAELRFIGSEVDHFSSGGFERDPKEVQMANRIIKNVENSLDVQYQRNLILDDILK